MDSTTSRERLAFNLGPLTVPGRGPAEAAIRNAEPTFATSEYAEPRDWGYMGLLAFTAVLLMRPQENVPGLSALHLAELCAIIGIGPMLLHRFARRLPVFRVTPETFGLFILGATILGTAPFSIWPGGAIGVFTDLYVKMLVVFVLMMNTLTTPKLLERLTWLILICMGYIAARGVFDYARGVHLVEDGRLASAVGGIFGNPNDLALNMVTFLPVAVVVAIAPRNGTMKRAAAAGIGLLMLATIVFTKSRGGIVGLVMALMVLLFLAGKIRRGFGVIVLLAAVVATPFLPSSFLHRMATIIDDKADRTEYTGSRVTGDVVERGIQAFVDHLFTGVGAGQFKNYNPAGRRARETHNALIQTASEPALRPAHSSFLSSAPGWREDTRRMLLKNARRRGVDISSLMTDADRESLCAHGADDRRLRRRSACAMFASVA